MKQCIDKTCYFTNIVNAQRCVTLSNIWTFKNIEILKHFRIITQKFFVEQINAKKRIVAKTFFNCTICVFFFSFRFHFFVIHFFVHHSFFCSSFNFSFDTQIFCFNDSNDFLRRTFKRCNMFLSNFFLFLSLNIYLKSEIDDILTKNELMCWNDAFCEYMTFRKWKKSIKKKILILKQTR